jgi:hypothetical protein
VPDGPEKAPSRQGAMKRKGAGRWILSSAATLTAVGGFLADWNRTHLFNPNWPPHAKFHDAQSILLGSFLGAGGLYLLWRRGEHPESDLALGALLPAFFWMAQGASFILPGAEGLEAEFPEKVPRIRGLWLNERVPSALMLVVIAIGYLAERGRRA